MRAVSTDCPGWRYDALAEFFWRCHGYMAPGKDMPAAMGGRPHDSRDRWESFVSMLGPSDRVGCFALYYLNQ